MLSREICGRCRVEAWKNVMWAGSSVIEEDRLSWICAAVEGYSFVVNINESPPPKCFKLFEQAIAGTVNIDKKE